MYKVPLVNLPLPIGLENTDLLIGTLSKITGNALPEELALERGWLLDGMADSHKYNADGRPVVYRRTGLVYAFSSACAENGAMPLVIASGSKNSHLAELLAPLHPECRRTTGPA